MKLVLCCLFLMLSLSVKADEICEELGAVTMCASVDKAECYKVCSTRIFGLCVFPKEICEHKMASWQRVQIEEINTSVKIFKIRADGYARSYRTTAERFRQSAIVCVSNLIEVNWTCADRLENQLTELLFRMRKENA